MKIRNKKTGEVKEIHPKEAKKYGLNAKKAYGGYMQEGGKMTLDEFMKKRKLMEQQMTTPIGASKLIDYPPVHTIIPTPKQKSETKAVYPPYQPKQYIPLPSSPIVDYPPTYTQSPEFAMGGMADQFMATGGCMNCGGKMQAGGKLTKDQLIELKNPNIRSMDYINGALANSIDYTKDSAWRASALNDYNNMLAAHNYLLQQDSINNTNRLREIDSLKNSTNWLDKIKGYGKDLLGFENGGLMEAGDGKWIQKAINPKHKGYCTPMTKSTCTPRRKALAKTLKKMAKNRKADGGYALGGTYEMTDAQIKELQKAGYGLRIV